MKPAIPKIRAYPSAHLSHVKRLDNIGRRNWQVSTLSFLVAENPASQPDLCFDARLLGMAHYGYQKCFIIHNSMSE